MQLLSAQSVLVMCGVGLRTPVVFALLMLRRDLQSDPGSMGE